MQDPRLLLSKTEIDAVLFDLDGVLTDTAKIHAACWKQIFDAFLEQHAQRAGIPFVPFDRDAEYRLHVDGKKRYDGVRDFLASRKITLPEGRADEPGGERTVCGLGNQKDALVQEVIESEGVEAYEGSRAFVTQVRQDGIRTAVVSSSHHCPEVLESAGLAGLFDARVDGNVIDDLALPGKPAPDSFLEGARLLGVDPARAVVVEDALSGVAAGCSGGFALVIGVARKNDAEALAEGGAHLVVEDLSELVRA